jgi:hypothetical protein
VPRAQFTRDCRTSCQPLASIGKMYKTSSGNLRKYNVPFLVKTRCISSRNDPNNLTQRNRKGRATSNVWMTSNCIHRQFNVDKYGEQFASSSLSHTDSPNRERPSGHIHKRSRSRTRILQSRTALHENDRSLLHMLQACAHRNSHSRGSKTC